MPALESVQSQPALGQPLPAGTPTRLPRVIQALRHRQFRYFWFGAVLSNTGTWIQNVGEGWLVLQIAPSHPAFWLGAVGAATAGPMLLFSLLGGVIADRANKRRLMLISQVCMMLIAFTLAFLTWRQLITVQMVVALAFATGVASALNMPAYQAIIPSLVPQEDLANAVALNHVQFNLSRTVGPSVGGFLMAWLGATGNYTINGLSFLAVIFALMQIHYVRTVSHDTHGWKKNLADGFRYVRQQRIMLLLLALVALASMFGLPYIVFIPLFARDVLGLGARGLGLLLACAGMGAMTGSSTVAYLARTQFSGRFVAGAAVGFFLSIIGFSFSRWWPLSAVMLVSTGFCSMLLMATVSTLLHHISSDEMRGRVMSFYVTAFLGFAPLGSLMAGSAAGWITAPHALALMCALAAVMAGWLYFSNPEMRELE
jgi:predicted MFS family arabinose efflux permease